MMTKLDAEVLAASLRAEMTEAFATEMAEGDNAEMAHAVTYIGEKGEPISHGAGCGESPWKIAYALLPTAMQAICAEAQDRGIRHCDLHDRICAIAVAGMARTLVLPPGEKPVMKDPKDDPRFCEVVIVSLASPHGIDSALAVVDRTGPSPVLGPWRYDLVNVTQENMLESDPWAAKTFAWVEHAAKSNTP